MVKNVGRFNRPYTPGNANPAFIIAASADSEGRPAESCSYKPIIGSLAILCIGRLQSA